MGEIIESWASQPNYPLIRASVTKSNELSLLQQVFKFNCSTDIGKNNSRYWWIPVKVNYASGDYGYVIDQELHWLGPENKTKEVKFESKIAEDGWYVLNPRQIGYYRVDYDLHNWEALVNLLDSEEFKLLTGTTRAALIDDAFNLARAGIRDYSLPLELAAYLHREDEYVPWVAACRAIKLLNHALKDRPFVARIFKVIFIFFFIFEFSDEKI